MFEVGVCEDDDALRQLLRSMLERAGCRVHTAASGRQAIDTFTRRVPDVLILDVGLPDADGRDVCQALRARGVRAPVLFLTARDTLTDKLSGFHAGGDDYLTKPFAAAELVVRCEALVRRVRRSSVAPGGIDPARRSVEAGSLGGLLDPADHGILTRSGSQNGRVPLTPTEYRLLAAICAAEGAVVRRATLIAAAWPDGAIVSENTLDAYVSRLRAKLRQAERREALANVRGVGYALR